MGGKDGSPGGGPWHWYYLPLMWLMLLGPPLTATWFMGHFESSLGRGWSAFGGLLIWIGGSAGLGAVLGVIRPMILRARSQQP